MTDAETGQGARARWTDLFRAARIASDPAKVWLAFLGILVALFMTLLALGILLELRSLTGGVISRNALDNLRDGDAVAMIATLDRGVGQTMTDLRGDVADIRDSLWTSDLLPALLRASTLRKVAACFLMFLLLAMLPWAYYGGAVSRGAAVEYASGERLTTSEMREFAAERWTAYFWAPVALAALIALLLLACVLIGLTCAHLLAALAFVLGLFGSLFVLVLVKQKARSGTAGALAGLACLLVTLAVAWLLWPVRLVWLSRVAVVVAFPALMVLGIAAVIALLVLLFGRGLMTSAVSFEGTNFFDAVSRAADYVCRRPWRLASCFVAGSLYAVPCIAVAVLIVAAAFFTAVIAAWLGFGGSFQGLYDLVTVFGKDAGFLERVPAFLFWAVFCVAAGLVLAWVTALVQALSAIIYARIRESVDGSPPFEIYIRTDRLPPPAPPEPAHDSSEQPQ